MSIHCLTCGYDLRGLPGDPIRCPECGKLTEVRHWRACYLLGLQERCDRLSALAGVLAVLLTVLLFGVVLLAFGVRAGWVPVVIAAAGSALPTALVYANVPRTAAGAAAFGQLLSAWCVKVLAPLAVFPGALAMLVATDIFIGRYTRSEWIIRLFSIAVVAPYAAGAFMLARWAQSGPVFAARTRVMEAFENASRPNDP